MFSSKPLYESYNKQNKLVWSDGYFYKKQAEGSQNKANICCVNPQLVAYFS